MQAFSFAPKDFSVAVNLYHCSAKEPTNNIAQPPVSILKQPINIEHASANQKSNLPTSGSSRATAWSQQQASTSRPQ